MCIGMHIDMCAINYADVWIHMYIGMHIDIRIDMCVDTCIVSQACYFWQRVVGLSPVRIGTTLGELRA